MDSAWIASRRRGLKQPVKRALRSAEVASESVQISIPIERLQIFAVKFQRLGVGLPRMLWIAQARDGTQVAIGCGCGFAVLLKSCPVCAYARGPLLRHGTEQGLCVLGFPRLQ